MVKHSELQTEEIHVIHRWQWQDRQEREAESVIEEDLYKIGFQTDEEIFYVLVDTTPIEWRAINTDSSTESISGIAGGDLNGTYPNPSVVNDSHTHTPGVTIPEYPTSLPPSGPVNSEDLTGSYPNPILKNTTVIAGTYTNATFTVDSKGRILAASSAEDNVEDNNEGSPDFNNVNLTGVATAPTPSYGVSNSLIATTKFTNKSFTYSNVLEEEESLVVDYLHTKTVDNHYYVEGSIKVLGSLIIKGTKKDSVLNTTSKVVTANSYLMIPKNECCIKAGSFKILSSLIVKGSLVII